MGLRTPVTISYDFEHGTGSVFKWMVPYWQLGAEMTSADKSKYLPDLAKATTALEWLMKVDNIQGGWAAMKEAQKDLQWIEKFPNGATTHVQDTQVSPKYPQWQAVPNLKLGFMPHPLPPGGRQAAYAGGAAICFATGGKNHDGAFAFVDYMYGQEFDLAWAQLKDRLPANVATAKSEDYIRGNALLRLAVQLMEGGRFVVSAPGGSKLLGITAPFVTSIREGKQTIPEALAQHQQEGQTAMDEWTKKADEKKL